MSQTLIPATKDSVQVDPTSHQVPKLSDDDISRFFQLGYLFFPGLFRSHEIAAFDESFKRLSHQARKFRQPTCFQDSYFVVHENCINRIVWCGGMEPTLLHASADTRLVYPASQLLGSVDVNQIICQAHFKFPGDNVTYRWHQDSENRGYGTEDWQDINRRGSYVQTVMAIDAMHSQNGPLRLIPHSCQKGHLGLDKMEDVDAYFADARILTLDMQPGDVVMFGPYTVHGSEANESAEPRRVFINGYAYPGANRRHYPGGGLGRTLRASLQG